MIRKTVSILLLLLFLLSVPASAAGVSARFLERKKTIASYFPALSEKAAPSFSDRLFFRLSRDDAADEILFMGTVNAIK